MASINDLLSNLTQQNPISPMERPETWRICFVVPDAARFWRDGAELLRALRQEGFAVHVLAHDDRAIFDLMNASGIVTCGLPRCDALMRGLAFSPVIYPIIQGHLIEYPPTLIHVESEPLMSLCVLASRLLDEAPLIVGSLRGERPPLDRFKHLLPVRAPLEYVEERYWSMLSDHLSLFLTTSREELSELMDASPMVSKKLEMWPGGSGYEHGHFDPTRGDLPTRDELRDMADIPASWECVVGVAGDFVGDRACLIETIKKVTARAPHIGWLLAKTPGMQEDPELSASGRVMWIEPGEHGMPLFASLCDLICSARQSARHTTLLLEAQAMGTPCVAFSTRYHRAVVEHGVTGSLVPVDQKKSVKRHGDALAEAILALESAPELRQEMAKAGRERVSKMFTRQSSHEQLMRLYDRVLSRRYALT